MARKTPRDERPTRPRWAAAALAVLLSSASTGVIAADDDLERKRARRADLIERAAVRLIQLDVTVQGPAEVVEALTKDDFWVQVARKPVPEFEVDRVCREPVVVGEPAGTTAGPVPVVTTGLGPTTFMFYLDQTHMTLGGRQQAIDTVRGLVDELVVDGNRAMIVSNAERLDTIVELTSDRAELHAAIDRLEHTRDPDLWDTYGQREENRLREILDAMQQASALGGLTRAQQIASVYYREELWRTQRSLNRLAISVARLESVDPPKAVVYFADTMRAKAGQHYLYLFGRNIRERISDPFDASTTLDTVMNEASSHGTRFYSVMAQGLAAVSPMVTPFDESQERDALRSIPQARFDDTRDSLAGLSLETGGRSYLRGAPPAKIAREIRSDLECLYLISIRPEVLGKRLRLDQALGVKIRVPDHENVQVMARGRVVVPSEKNRRTSRLLAAYTLPEAEESPYELHVQVIPRGYEGGDYLGTLQLSVKGLDLPVSTWDMGVAIVVRGKVRHHTARLKTNRPDLPIAMLHPMEFPPGEFEIMAVAHNVDTDEIASAELNGEWPRPKDSLASIGPLAVLQPVEGAVLSGDTVKTSSPLAFAEDEPLDPDRATALRSVVCHSPDNRRPMRVSRTVLGAGGEPVFEAEGALELDDQRCAVIQDIIAPSLMGSGTYRYRLRVSDEGGADELAATERKFHVWDREESLEDLLETVAPATTAGGSTADGSSR